MNANNTLAEAAEILTTEAEALRVCSTFEGDWGDEHDARADYERMLRVARELWELEAARGICG